MRPSSTTRTETGLSIIETSIVFLVMAIVIAIALPMISNSIQAYNLRSAADHVAERLAAARALAIEKNRNITVALQPTGQYGLDFNADGVPDSSDPAEPGKSYYVETLPSGTAFASTGFPLGGGSLSITFNSRGELPIGTVIAAGAPGVGPTLQNGSRTAGVWVNLRGRVWVQ